ncbi:MAG TPA: hypothetical protein VGN34_11270 [Ktedonobacteraceae bacterium]|jgi:hypothetical protein
MKVRYAANIWETMERMPIRVPPGPLTFHRNPSSAWTTILREMPHDSRQFVGVDGSWQLILFPALS